jgi:hypothetical protein
MGAASNNETAIKITAKLYKCRDTAKRFFKDEYPAKIDPYRIIVKKVMKANKVDEIGALLIIGKTNAYQNNGMAQMLFMATIVELIEPSE